MRLVAIASDSLNRTRLGCLKTKRNFLWCLGLVVNVVMPALVVALEVLGAKMGAEFVVETLIIDVELARGVLRVAVMKISHVSENA